MDTTKKGFSHLFIIILIVLVGVVGFAAYNVLHNQDKNDVTTKSASSFNPDETPLGEQKPIASVLEKVNTLLSNENSFVKYEASPEETYAQINYQPDDFDFKVQLDAVENSLTYNLRSNVQPSDTVLLSEEAIKERDAKDRVTVKPFGDSIVVILRESGFSKLNDTSRAVLNTGESLYLSAENVCLLTHRTNLSLECAPKTDFTSKAKIVSPFVEIYQNAIRAETPDMADFSKDTYAIEETGHGKTDNNKYTKMLTGNAIAYFYTDNNGNNWKYFSSTQQGFACDSEFNTEEAFAAFSSICFQSGP